MEFWGVEVKPGQSLRCDPGEDKLIHLSQAALGVTKDKGSESIPLYVTVNNQKLVLGTLSSVTFPQIPYDLVFEKEFELSHGSKSATVYFCGYRADVEDKQNLSDDEICDSESEEDVPVDEKPNGKPKGTEPVEKSKPKVQKEVKPATEKEDDSDDSDDSDDDSEDSDDLDDSDNDKVMMDALGDDDDDSDDDEDDDGSEDEDEETPTPKNNKKESGKKRPAESASKTPAPEKKAKLVSPAGQKTGGDGKKGGHVATPHPAKQAAKTPANSDKKQQTPKPPTPKSAGSGSVSCNSCSKTFNSEKALESHSKAKHGASK